jgi:excinuclease ABC subunit B
VGINLLREGLDLPEVSLVAILDADKEGFLRSARSLIQTIGRAARNSEGRVIMYGDRITAAMQQAISETDRRRIIQSEYNITHGITPATTRRTIKDLSAAGGDADYYSVPKPSKHKTESSVVTQSRKAAGGGKTLGAPSLPAPEAPILSEEVAERIEELRSQMFAAAENLEFETAARIRDELSRLQGGSSSEGEPAAHAPPMKRAARKR